MSHVSGRFIADLLDAVQRLEPDLDMDALIAGLSIERATLRKGHPKYAWDEFVELMTRVEARLGGPEGMERLGGGFDRISIARVLRRLAGFAATPLALYSAAERWALPRVLPQLESRIDILDRGRLRVVCRIPGTHRPCPQLLHIATGVLRSAPTILGLPHAEVRSDVQPRFGEWIVTPPASRSLWTRLGNAVRAAFSTRAALEQLEKQQDELEDGFQKLTTAYRSLEESEARYRALADSAVDLIVEIAPDLRIRYASPSTWKMIGRAAAEIHDSELDRWIHPEDRERVSDFLVATFSRHEHTGERPVFRMQRKTDSWSWMEMDASLYRKKTGEDCAVAMIRNVDQRIAMQRRDREYRETLEAEVQSRTRELERKNRDLRELQSLLLDAERMGTARDLAGRVAHSINNPLGALMGQISLMLVEDETPDPRLQELLDLAQRVGDVVARTLELYREGKIDRRSESVSDIMDDLLQSVTTTTADSQISVDCRLAEDLPRLQVDRPLLVTALESIASNAIEWMSPGGRLFLEATHSDAEGRIRITIADTGPGVSPELREQIFSPFFTTKPSGTGLGLAIANGIIRGHEGELFVDERPGGGARFRVELPLRANL